MKKNKFLLLLFCAISLGLSGSPKNIENDSLIIRGKADYTSAFFSNIILHNSFTGFLDNYSDYIVVQNEVTGDFGVPDQNLISIQGNSYRWTKYYQDGFRINQQTAPGSSLYSQSLYNNSFVCDNFEGGFYFKKDETIENNVLIQYNLGNIGNMNPWTEALVSHNTALRRLYKDIDYRKHMTGQGVARINLNLQHKGQNLPQHFYFDKGQRQLIGFDYTSEAYPYDEDYIKTELNGELPVRANAYFDKLNYALAYSKRDHLFHEFYYNENETAENQIISGSVWTTKNSANGRLVSGISISNNKQEHHNKDFSRNFIDMDGESFTPYYPDAEYLEVSHAFNYSHDLGNGFLFTADNYNSFIHTNSDGYSATNSIYYQSLVDPQSKAWLSEDAPFYSSLYITEWESSSFSSGILENEISVSRNFKPHEKVSINGSLGFSLDGMLLSNKSIVRPNWQAELLLTWKTGPFFSTGLNISRKRIPFHFDMITYLSDDYLNGKAYFWDDVNNDKFVNTGETNDLFFTSGGAYRQTTKGINQPAYLIVDWPLIFNFGKGHTFSIVSTYKKFFNMWQTSFDGPYEEYGYFQMGEAYNEFYLQGGQAIPYTVNSDPPASMNFDHSVPFLSNTPFAFTNIIKYTYQSEKVFASASWVSQAMDGPGIPGNSIQENNLELFSDALANPNSHYKQISRPQQDRGFMAHGLFGYRINANLKTSFLLKFIDGQPFSSYLTSLNTNATSQTQALVWNRVYKGSTHFTEEWGSREDFLVNTELRIAYSFKLKDSKIEFNASVYNLIDFASELVEASFPLPTTGTRNAIELGIPRGVMFSVNVKI